MYDNFLQSKIAKHCIAVVLIASVLVSSVPGGFAAPDRSDAAIPVAAAGVAAVATALIAAGVLTDNTDDLLSFAEGFIDWASALQLASVNAWVTSASVASAWVSTVIDGIEYRTLDYDSTIAGYIYEYLNTFSNNGSISNGLDAPLYSDNGFRILFFLNNPIFTFPSYTSSDFTLITSEQFNALPLTLVRITPSFSFGYRVGLVPANSTHNNLLVQVSGIYNGNIMNTVTYSETYPNYNIVTIPSVSIFARDFMASNGTRSIGFSLSYNNRTSWVARFVYSSSTDSVNFPVNWVVTSSDSVFSEYPGNVITGQFLNDQSLNNGSTLAIPAHAFDNDNVSLGNYADTLILDSNGDVVLPYPGVVPGVLPGEITTEWDDYDITDTPDDVQLSPDGTTPISRIPILGNIADALRKLWELLKEGFNKLLAWLQSLLDAITGLISGIVGGIVGFFGARFPDIPDLIDEIINLLRQLLDLLGNLITSLPAFVVDILAFISGYTVYQTLFNAFLPAPVALVCWTFWLVILGIGVFRMVLAR